MTIVTAVLSERYNTDNQLHRRLQQRIHHSPHVYTELALTDTSTVLQVCTQRISLILYSVSELSVTIVIINAHNNYLIRGAAQIAAENKKASCL